jgi:hypothetical protein
MKKFLLIGLIAALALVIVGGTGLAFARAQNIEKSAITSVEITQNGGRIIRQFGYGPSGMMGGDGFGYGYGGMMGGDEFGYGVGGMMGGRGNNIGPGMMGGRGARLARGAGIMHDDMISAFADAVDLTVDEVNTRLESGETIREIAIAQGFTEEQLPDLVTQVRQAALDKAVADGDITQAQADLMLEHMNEYIGEGFGPGFGSGTCPMLDNDEVPQP